MYQKVRVAATVLACALLSSAAYAAPVTADFTAEHGFFGGGGSCNTFSASGRSIGAGAELGLGDQVLNIACSGALGMDWNPLSGILTVSGVDGTGPGEPFANYALISLSIANVLFDVVGEQISAVALLSQNLFTTGFPNRFDPAPLIAFTGNGIDIDWFVPPGGDNTLMMSILAGGTATFQVTTSTPTTPTTPTPPTGVPEPSTLLLLSSGLALTGMGKRRQRQHLA